MNYLKIANHYNQCFEKNGDTHLGVDWPNYEDTLTRYKIMLELINVFRISVSNPRGNWVSPCKNNKISPVAIFAPAFICSARPRWVNITFTPKF